MSRRNIRVWYGWGDLITPYHTFGLYVRMCGWANNKANKKQIPDTGSTKKRAQYGIYKNEASGGI